MREHQIAINLKAQQFELLQKLARERGFKSVTAYVKQKIVELALGLDDEGGASDDDAAYGRRGIGESKALVEDLSRIHGDLKAFLGQDGQAVAQSNFAGSKAALEGSFDDSRDFDSGDFDLPPPGQNLVLPNSPQVPGAGNGAGAGAGVSNQGSAQSSGSHASANGPLGVPSASADASAPVSSQVLPSNNLGGFGFRLGGYAAASAMNRYQAPVETNADRLAGYREVMDDLEELADRAFAISPRLGALDEDAPAEAATARGGRSETILVEPILPSAGASHSFSGAHPRSEAPMAPPAPTAPPASTAAPKQPPVNMVKPVSAADLPGPKEMAASAASAAAAAAPTPSPVAPATEREPISVGVSGAAPSPAPVAPTSEHEPISVHVSTAPPIPAEALAETLAETPALAPEEDDLLSELLDESLVAHAHAPRPATNPFVAAVPVAFEAPLENSSPSNSSYEAPSDAEIEAVFAEEEAAEEATAAEVTAPGAPVITQVVTRAEALALKLPAGSQAAFDESSTGDTYPALGANGGSYADASAESESESETERENEAAAETQRRQQSQSGNQGQASQSQTGGQPGVSGGPPPKRRRT